MAILLDMRFSDAQSIEAPCSVRLRRMLRAGCTAARAGDAYDIAPLYRTRSQCISRGRQHSLVSQGEPRERDRREDLMFTRIIRACSGASLALLLALSTPVITKAAEEDGIVRVKSSFSMAETISRLRKDIADKGIR